jgi:tetratricopeptide (TPR) repeat protein
MAIPDSEGPKGAPHAAAGSPSRLSRLAAARARRGAREEALALLEAALRQDPNHVPALANLGGLLVEEGKLDEAEAVLRRALSLDPIYAPAHRNLAALFRRRGAIEAMVREERAYMALWAARERQRAKESLGALFRVLRRGRL